MKSARILIEVSAGLIPGQPEPEYTRQWGITSEQWEANKGKDFGSPEQLEILRVYGTATEYAATLRNPGRFNWVRVDWIYL